MVEWRKTDIPTRVEYLQKRYPIDRTTEEVRANTEPKIGFEHTIMTRSTRV